MNCHNDWDLSAIVRSCNNNINDNSSNKDVHVQEQTNVGFTQISEQSYDLSNTRGQRRYLGLEEVIDKFMNGNKNTEQPESPQWPNAALAPRPQNPDIHKKVKEVTALEVPAEKVEEWDGWEWRKYGKKKVCDSPYSKSYYRCSHEGNKCPAKKHVQKSHKDESKYIVTYRGTHSHLPPVQNSGTKQRRRRRSNKQCSISPNITNGAI